MDSNREPAVAPPAAACSGCTFQPWQAPATGAGCGTSPLVATGRRQQALTQPQGHLPCTR